MEKNEFHTWEHSGKISRREPEVGTLPTCRPSLRKSVCRGRSGAWSERCIFLLHSFEIACA
jgi:hypothetical protein